METKRSVPDFGSAFVDLYCIYRSRGSSICGTMGGIFKTGGKGDRRNVVAAYLYQPVPCYRRIFIGICDFHSHCVSDGMVCAVS